MNSMGKTFDSYASKRVSFIITTKNRAEHLRKALELHRKLVHPDDELIIVDGLSTDGTAKVVKEYADLVDVFISEPDESGAHALNKGILLAQGNFIKQIPDDDVIYPEAMEQAIQVLEQHPEVDILYCGGTRQVGERLSYVYLSPGVGYGKSAKDVFIYGATGIGFIYRRSALSKVGLLHPTDAVADNEIILRAIARGANVKFCRVNLFHHPIYEHSVTRGQRSKWEEDRNRLLREYCSFRFYFWYRWIRPFHWYYMKRRLIPILLKPPGALRTARVLRDILRKVHATKQVQTTNSQNSTEVSHKLWDGGFS